MSELPNFTATDTISTGDKQGCVRVNEFEIKWKTVGNKLSLVVGESNNIDSIYDELDIYSKNNNGR